MIEVNELVPIRVLREQPHKHREQLPLHLRVLFDEDLRTQANLQKRDRETRRNEPVHIIRVLEDSLDVAEIKERLEWKSPNAFGGAAAIEVSDVAGFAMCGKCGSTASAGAGRYS